MRPKSKPFYQSATIWLSAIVGFVGGLIELANQISPFITDERWHARIAATIGILTAISTFLLRLQTHMPIQGSPGEKKSLE